MIHCRRAALTLLIAFLALAAPAAARTLVTGANGYTLNPLGQLHRFAALLVSDDGHVVATYGRSARLPALTPRDTRVDARGRTLLPGLIDAHGHVMGLGYQALAVDLTGARSLDDALATVTAYVAANPGSGWIVGRGWNQERWPGKAFPSAADLAAVAPARPVYLERVDGHAAWVNAAALAAAKITAATPDPPGGRIARGADGAPTGLLIDAAKGLVEAVLPPPTPAQAARALDKALGILASVGLTQVADMGTSPADWALYRRYRTDGRLTVRIAAYAGGVPALLAIVPDWRRDPNDATLQLAGTKLYADGALGSRGAWLLADYADALGQRGLRFNTDAALREQVNAALREGRGIAVHAIGDAANRQVLDAFAAMDAHALGHTTARIEHAQIVDPADLPRFAELGVIASIQPTHATSDKGMAEARLGEARLAGGYAWATLLRSGARLAAGSDFPVEPANPFYGWHAAVTRQDRDGNPPGGWRIAEALTREQAFAAFTTGAAAANGMARTGRLTPGARADFIIVDRDPFAVEAGDIWRTVVDETWVGGKRVFKR